MGMIIAQQPRCAGGRTGGPAEREQGVIYHGRTGMDEREWAEGGPVGGSRNSAEQDTGGGRVPLRAVERGGVMQDEGRGARPAVLVVDDDAHDRDIYGRILCYNGFDVVMARDAAGALDMANSHHVDLVLLDFGLPDASGLDLLKTLRRRRDFEETPVIALTGYSRDRMGKRAREAGCTEYIEKPAGPVAVLHSVERLIGRAPLPGVGRPPRVIEQQA
jgi:two-component system, chemotaxis family, chemotaxis protein CheY